jgi:hypothetical protein
MQAGMCVPPERPPLCNEWSRVSTSKSLECAQGPIKGSYRLIRKNGPKWLENCAQSKWFRDEHIKINDMATLIIYLGTTHSLLILALSSIFNSIWAVTSVIMLKPDFFFRVHTWFALLSITRFTFVHYKASSAFTIVTFNDSTFLASTVDSMFKTRWADIIITLFTKAVVFIDTFSTIPWILAVHTHVPIGAQITTGIVGTCVTHLNIFPQLLIMLKQCCHGSKSFFSTLPLRLQCSVDFFCLQLGSIKLDHCPFSKSRPSWKCNLVPSQKVKSHCKGLPVSFRYRKDYRMRLFVEPYTYRKNRFRAISRHLHRGSRWHCIEKCRNLTCFVKLMMRPTQNKSIF